VRGRGTVIRKRIQSDIHTFIQSQMILWLLKRRLVTGGSSRQISIFFRYIAKIVVYSNILGPRISARRSATSASLGRTGTRAIQS
jgi:hypothetical protein